ncbi:MAG: hypothetical protein AB7O67_19365 [Vicinamibacterales bacterium]
MIGRILVVLMLCAALAAPAVAQSLSAAPLAAPVPDSLAPDIAARFGDGTAGTPAVVTVGDGRLEVWWVTGIEPYAAGDASWVNVDQGALVGAMRVTGPFKDVRGRTVEPGVYTLRYGLQPQNGDHLGVSPYREFLLMSPAALDADPAALGYDAVTKLSARTIGTSHPAALSLDPPEQADGAPLSAYTNDMDLQGIVFEAPFAFEGKPLGTVRFGLILVGIIQH